MPQLQNVPFKNMGLSRATLIPTRVLNTEASNEPIELNCTNKGLPSFDDAPIWEIITDNPEKEVGERIKGKCAGMKVLEFTETYDPVRIVQLSKHLTSTLDVEIIYDDPKLPFIAAITIPDCELINPGDSSGGETNAKTREQRTFQGPQRRRGLHPLDVFRRRNHRKRHLVGPLGHVRIHRRRDRCGPNRHLLR